MNSSDMNKAEPQLKIDVLQENKSPEDETTSIKAPETLKKKTSNPIS